MREDTAQPSGTVSFLFTDIEGSTKLAQEYPTAMQVLLARHHEILTRSVRPYSGYVFQISGDAFCVAFHSAGDALRAAVEAQQRLNQEAWTPAPVRVRMGIHTGQAAIQSDGSYAGYLTLSQAQRLMSAAHGGQVLISSATQELVRSELPAGIELRDMGQRRLKDLIQLEHVYQLVIPNLPADFPPIAAPEAARHNLPAQITSFIGRGREVVEIGQLLREHRLVTLTGSGGAGKTRLGLETAAAALGQFADGAWLVELAPVSDPALIPQTLFSALQLREAHRRDPMEILVDHLREKALLLVLDNCEHVIEACAHLAEALLRACPHVRILATSREALGIAGEVAYRVPSLGTLNPERLPPLDEVRKVDSIQLFVERAAAARPGLQLTEANAPFIAEICARLDGIPLAIELAASRMKVLSPEQLASRLDDRFRLLTGGSRTALPRQQTLRAMIDWSYSLLSEPEKVLFRRLAVFAGGWTLQAAESVCAGDQIEPNVMELLAHLVDKSLAFTDESGGEMRYRRLETIRQYSREKLLETDEAEPLRDRHLKFFVEFAESVDEHLKGSDQVVWQKRMETELDNLRAALDWGLSRAPDSALRIAGAANLFWTAGGFSAEGFRWTQKALERTELAALPPDLTRETRQLARARALRGLTRLYLSLGDNASARRAAEESVALYRLGTDQRGLAFALVILAYPLEFLGERAAAEAALQESYAIARREGDVYVMCRALNRLARVIADLYHETDLARGYLDESIRLARSSGLRSQEAQAIETLGTIAAQRGNPKEARDYLKESMSIYEEIGASFNVLLEKSNLAHLERGLAQYSDALDYYRQTITAFRDIGQTGAVAHQLECFGFIALAQEDGARAVRLFSAADRLREQSGTPMTPDERTYFDEQLQSLQARMDPGEFASIWSKASALTMQQAIELALSTA